MLSFEFLTVCVVSFQLLNAAAVGSFSVNCGGKELSLSGIDFFSDTTPLGMADFYISSNHRWAVSSSQSFISKSNGSNFIVNTDEPMPKLYQTARISTRSLRYYVVGLQNGTYKVELFFAEIVMDDTPSWTGLGRRIFNIYIQVLSRFEYKLLGEKGCMR